MRCLGLTNDPSGENEITPGSFLQINLANIPAAERANGLSFQTSSTTGSDAWVLTAGNANGVFGGNPVAACNAATSATSCDVLITDRVQIVSGPFVGHSGLCTQVLRQQIGVLLLMFKTQRQVQLRRDAIELI